MYRAVLAFFLAFWLALLAGRAAQAHPHVWIDASLDFLFAADGSTLEAVEVHWLFDEFFSLTLLEDADLDKDGTVSEAEWAAMAATMVENLRPFGYFLHIRQGEQGAWSQQVERFTLEADPSGMQVLATLAVRLSPPVDPRHTPVSVGVYDSDYFVAIDFPDDTPFRLSAPLPCTPELREDPGSYNAMWMVTPVRVHLECS